MLNPLIDDLADYPFDRLRALLDGIAPPPGLAPLVLSVGEPRHPPPPLVAEILAAHADDWGRYPPVEGTPEFRQRGRRLAAPPLRPADGLIDPDRHVLPVAGTREALFLIGQVAVPAAKAGPAPPLVLMPNPFYQVYFGAAVFARAEPVFLPATRRDRLPARSRRPRRCDAGAHGAALSVLAGQPAGGGGQPRRPAARGRWRSPARHDFVLCVDECYADIYDRAPPPGALAARMLPSRCGERRARQRRRLPFAVQALERARPALRLRRRRRPADRRLPPAARLRRRHAAAAGAGRLDRAVAGRRARRGQPGALPRQVRSGRAPARRAIRLLPARPAASSCGSTSATASAAARRCGQQRRCACCRAPIWQGLAATAAIPARRYIRVALIDDLADTEDALRRLLNVL